MPDPSAADRDAPASPLFTALWANDYRTPVLSGATGVDDDTREREVIQEALGHLYTLPSLDDAGAFLDALGDLGWKVCPK